MKMYEVTTDLSSINTKFISDTKHVSDNVDSMLNLIKSTLSSQSDYYSNVSIIALANLVSEATLGLVLNLIKDEEKGFKPLTIISFKALSEELHIFIKEVNMKGKLSSLTVEYNKNSLDESKEKNITKYSFIAQ